MKQLTDRTLKALKSRTYTYDVIEGAGFGVRVTPKGVVSFQYTYRERGKRRRLILGRYGKPGVSLAEARRQYRIAHGARLQGRDPAGEVQREKVKRQIEETERRRAEAKRKQEPTVSKLAERYIELYAKRNKKSWREDERLLKAVTDRFGDMLVKDIERRYVVALLDHIAERAPVAANRTLAVTRKMFNWAASRGEIESSPVAGTPAPGGKETPRERFLSVEEIAALWMSLDRTGASPVQVAAIRFMLASGQRKSEVLEAPWTEFDLEAGWWEIPSRRTTNRLTHRVPITKTMRQLLDKVHGQHLTWVFVSPGRGKPYGRQSPNHLLARLFAQGELNGEKFTPHDLRRTVGTHLASISTVLSLPNTSMG